MWFISRKDAKLAKAVGFLCLFCVLLSAALSQRLGGLVLRFALCVLMWFNFTQGRKARKGYGFPVVILCVFERCAFAKAGWVSFTLRLLLSFVPFVVMCCVGFSQRRGGAEVLSVLYVFCVFRGFAFAEAVGEMSISFTLRLMYSYVTLCGLNFTQRRKARKGCGFSVFIVCVFERCAFAKAAGVILRFAFCFLLFLLW